MSIVGTGYQLAKQLVAQGLNAKDRKQLTKLSSAIAEDQSKYEKFMSANTQQRGNLIANIANTIGYGPLVESIRKQALKLGDKADEATSHHNKYVSDANAKTEQINNRVYDRGTSLLKDLVEADKSRYNKSLSGANELIDAGMNHSYDQSSGENNDKPANAGERINNNNNNAKL